VKKPLNHRRSTMEAKAAKIVELIVEYVGTSTEGAWRDKKAHFIAAMSSDDEIAVHEFLSWFEEDEK
jgi:hypothetical protein